MHAVAHRIGFSRATISVGALLHIGGLVAAHAIAKRFESPLAKLATYGGLTVGAGFVCKLLHERETRHEKQLLGMIEKTL